MNPVTGSKTVGRYTSDQHILARFSPEADLWLRLPAHASLAAGERLLTLPFYRPQLMLAPGIHLVVYGPAEIKLLETDAGGVPGVEMKYGRLVVMMVEESKTGLNLVIGDRRSRVLLQDLDATLALEVRHHCAPGGNPEKDPTYRMVRIHSTGGGLTWHDQLTGDVTNLQADQTATMVDMESPVVSEEASPPIWLDSRDVRLIDRDASKELEPLLTLDKPLSVSLNEQAKSRLPEVRSLAIASLALVNEFTHYVDAFNDKELRSYWTSLVRALQEAMARDQQSAARVRSTLERLRGEEGSELYRMLCGFSAEQLAKEDAARLVEFLKSPSMDVRVIAFETLYRITEKTNTYRPDKDADQQKPAVMAWSRALNNGEIVYKTPSAGLPEFPK
ncbi:MAG: hypothetical protein FJ276_10840 [Planctomycetes bacterium]|nr:hypothetical protein [Planctomycetota bacterium]